MTTAIQEALVCPFLFEDSLHVALVLRRGRQCFLLLTLTGLEAGISASEDGLETISSSLKLPCRLLDGEEGALLARKTILADHEGSGFYRL
jgi:hypothetical protein